METALEGGEGGELDARRGRVRRFERVDSRWVGRPRYDGEEGWIIQEQMKEEC